MGTSTAEKLFRVHCKGGLESGIALWPDGFAQSYAHWLEVMEHKELIAFIASGKIRDDFQASLEERVRIANMESQIF